MNQKKINVCHIITGDLWAGAESQAYTLILGLSKTKSINLNVITFNNGILVKKLMASGIRVDVISEKSNSLPKMVWRLYNILRITGTGILHTHGYKETFLGGLAGRLCNVKAIVRTHHGKGVMETSLKHQFIEKLNRNFFTDKVISVSEDLKAFLISRGFKKNIITVMHNGIIANEVKPHREANNVKAELNIDDNVIIIGTMGRIVRVKGHKYFLGGAREILMKNENVVFIIAGDGPLMHEAEITVKKLNITKSVRLLGFRNDAYDILNICDIFVLTSLHEGIPMVLLEAMSMEKPIVSTNVGGIPEIISDHRNGLLIPSKNSAAFASACLVLIENSDLGMRLGETAKKDVEKKYSNARVAREIEKIYQELL